MDPRSVLSLSVIALSSWAHANPHIQVPERCAHLTRTFLDPRMYVEHDCSDVCDYVDPGHSPIDCYEQCPELYLCLMATRVGARVERAQNTEPQRTTLQKTRTTKAAIGRPKAEPRAVVATVTVTTPMRPNTKRPPTTAEPRAVVATVTVATPMRPNTRRPPTTAPPVPGEDKRAVATSAPEPSALPKDSQTIPAWQVYLLSGTLSFFGVLSVSLVGILIWRCTRTRKADDAKPAEKEGLVAVVVEVTTANTQTKAR